MPNNWLANLKAKQLIIAIFKLNFLWLHCINWTGRATIFRGLLFASILIAFKPSENISEFTGNKSTYTLQQSSLYKISGTVILKEKRDGTALVSVELTETSREAKYPVHLHLGDLATTSVSVEALLTPLAGKTEKSETILTHLDDETQLIYSNLIKL